MNANQMVLECRLSADSLDSSTIPDISNENWLYYLNVAQEEFIKSIQKRTDDLNNLTNTYFFAVSSVSNNTYFLNLQNPFIDESLTTPSTDKYMFYLRGNAKINSIKCGNRYSTIKIETLDTMDSILKNPFKGPNINRVIGYFEKGGLYLVTDGNYTLTNGKITFLRLPKIISNDPAYAPLNDCELAEHTHREIIAKAVELAVGDLKPEKLQVKIAQNTQEE